MRNMIDVSFPDCLGRSVRATRQRLMYDVRMTCDVIRIKATRWHVRPHTHAPPSTQCMWGQFADWDPSSCQLQWWGCLGDLREKKSADLPGPRPP